MLVFLLSWKYSVWSWSLQACLIVMYDTAKMETSRIELGIFHEVFRTRRAVCRCDWSGLVRTMVLRITWEALTRLLIEASNRLWDWGEQGRILDRLADRRYEYYHMSPPFFPSALAVDRQQQYILIMVALLPQKLQNSETLQTVIVSWW